MSGLFTQSAYVLLERPAGLDAVAGKLGAFGAVNRVETGLPWTFGGSTLLLPMLGSERGRVVVDVVDRPWPDDMEDPQRDPDLFGAWGFGQFGPRVWPGSLLRACQHHWGADVAARARKHRAFVRVRTTYAAGARGDEPVVPPDYDPLPELLLLTRVASALLDVPGALAYFNPSGESLREPHLVRQALEEHDGGGLPPYFVWFNRRLVHFEGSDWSMTDLVGLGQLGRPDHEACYPRRQVDPNDVPLFLYNTAHVLLSQGITVRDGQTTNNPYVRGQDWRARNFSRGKMPPPRPVVRWFPQGSDPPEALLAEAEE